MAHLIKQQDAGIQAEQADTTPLISIVTATYNASHMLQYAIRSVLRSNVTDWEMIIVGDHCTDDTEQVVAGFADPRIRFLNLATNSGQQATPNNVGVSMARGTYLCFLNQDDMFLPDHLSRMLAQLNSDSADILCAQYAVVEPFTAEASMAELNINAGGPLFKDSKYHPGRWYVASSWFMLRSTAQAAGEWRAESTLLVTPSQEWLFRAWRQGMRIVCTQQPSLVVLYSGARRGSYANSDAREHQHIFKLSASPQFAVDAAKSMLARESALRKTWPMRLRRIYCFLFERLLASIGIHPLAPEMLLRYGGRGGFVRRWRQITQ